MFSQAENFAIPNGQFFNVQGNYYLNHHTPGLYPITSTSNSETKNLVQPAGTCSHSILHKIWMTTSVPQGYYQGITFCPTSTSTFTGRTDTLEILNNFFFDSEKTQKAFLLFGLGGAGKTQVALEFRKRFRQK